jgi:hypothetical protein
MTPQPYRIQGLTADQCRKCFPQPPGHVGETVEGYSRKLQEYAQLAAANSFPSPETDFSLNVTMSTKTNQSRALKTILEQLCFRHARGIPAGFACARRELAP